VSSARPGARRATTAAALGVAAVVLVVFAGAILAGEQFYFRDLSQNHGPILQGASALLRTGQPPWWNPWSGGGQPLLANPNSLLLHPYGLLALLLPAGAGLAPSIVLSSLLGAIFLALLLRDLGRSGWAAAAGSLVWALSGYAISLGTLPNMLAAASMVPAALWLARVAFRSPAWLPAAVLATAFVLVPCEPASALVLAVFALIPIEGERRAARRPGAPSRWRRAASGAAILAGGLAAAGVQLLPALAWVRASARGADPTPAAALKWSLEPLRLPELVLPGFLGDPALFSAWWSGRIFETGFPLMLSLYVGAPALLLAFTGTFVDLRRASRRRSYGAAVATLAVPAAGLLFLVLATGRGVPWLLGTLPGGSFFRYPEKFFFGAGLALAIQAAIGVDRLIALPVRGSGAGGDRAPLRAVLGPRGDRPVVLASAGVAIALQCASALSKPAWAASWFSMRGSRPELVHDAFEGIRISCGFAAVSCLLFALVILLLPSFTHRLRGAALAASVAVSLLAGSLVFGPSPLPWRLRANPSAPSAALAADPYFAREIGRVRSGGRRVFRYDRPAEFAVKNRTGTLLDGFVWDRRSLARSSASGFGVELAFDRSTDLLNPLGMAEALRFFLLRPPAEQTRFWDLAGVGLVIGFTPLELPGFTRIAVLDTECRPPLVLHASQRALPRARLVRIARRVRSDSEAFEEIVRRGDAGRDEVRLVDPEGAASETQHERGDPDASGGSPGRDAPPSEIASSRTAQWWAAERRDESVPPAVPREPIEGAGPSRQDAAASGGGAEGKSTAAAGRLVQVVERRAGWLRVRIGSASGSASGRAARGTSPGEGGGVGDGTGGEASGGAGGDGEMGGATNGRAGGSARRGAAISSWLVVAENDVPGWSARLDGRPARIWRADGMHMAIEVPDGAPHEIELGYFPPGLASGASLSAASLAISAFAGAAASRVRRRATGARARPAAA